MRHVVADLDQVVELDAVLDHGVVAARRGRCRCWRRSRRRCRCAPRPAARSFPRRRRCRARSRSRRRRSPRPDAVRQRSPITQSSPTCTRCLEHGAGADARASLDHAQRADAGTSGSTTASGSMTALGWIAGPAAGARCFFHSWVSAGEVQVGIGRRRCSHRAASAASRMAGATITQPAREAASCCSVLGVAQEAQLGRRALLPAGPGPRWPARGRRAARRRAPQRLSLVGVATPVGRATWRRSG